MHIDATFSAIGRFAIRFRWLVVLVWIVGAIAAATQLPSLANVSQPNNTKFLPASAPSERAAVLAQPFGTAGLQPLPVVAARTSTPLTSADEAAMAARVAEGEESAIFEDRRRAGSDAARIDSDAAGALAGEMCRRICHQSCHPE